MSTLPFDVQNANAILLWERALDHIDYFELLGVNDGDNDRLIEAAYHRFALKFHPDCHPNVEPRLRVALTKIFDRGVEARRVLCDPQLRVRYRSSRKHGGLNLTERDSGDCLDFDRVLPRLHESCRSAGAKLEAMAAHRAWKQGNRSHVQRHLRAALAFDGSANAELENCLVTFGQLLRGADKSRR